MAKNLTGEQSCSPMPHDPRVFPWLLVCVMSGVGAWALGPSLIPFLMDRPIDVEAVGQATSAEQILTIVFSGGSWWEQLAGCAILLLPGLFAILRLAQIYSGK